MLQPKRGCLGTRLFPSWRPGAVEGLEHGLVAEMACNVNRGDPVIVLGIYIRVAGKEELHDVFAAIAHGQMQRRVAAPPASCIHLRTFGEQESDDLRVATIGRPVQGSSPMRGFRCVYLGPMEKEEHGRILVASPGSVVKRQQGKFLGRLGHAVGERCFGFALLSCRRGRRRGRYGRLLFGGSGQRFGHGTRGRLVG